MDDIQIVRSTKRPLDASNKGKKKKKQQNTAEDSLLEEAINCLKKEGKEDDQAKDEDDIFGKFIVSELKGIKDVRLKRQVKWRIQTAIYEAHNILPAEIPSNPWATVPTFGQPSYHQTQSSSSFQPIRPQAYYQASHMQQPPLSLPCSPVSSLPSHYSADTRPISRNSGSPSVSEKAYSLP